ncbi:MAG TPA: hypothetical protein VMU61_07480 [Candidatus Aquilonibacter sp.]|nr:hypothetical protein [Candidatus Aquilonibacter sp.]
MLRLRMSQFWMASAVLAVALAGVPALGAATRTFTGRVSDSMCGAKHHEGVDPATCVRACVKHGAKYALVVGDKVYTLDTSDQATLNKLDQLAWEDARVRGKANGDVITVSSVTAAK